MPRFILLGLAALAVPVAAFADPPPPLVDTGKIDLSGVWNVNGGTPARWRQTGDTFVAISRNAGTTITAQGHIAGSAVSWSFQISDGDEGQCKGILTSPDEIVVNCTHAKGSPYAATLTRAPG